MPESRKRRRASEKRAAETQAAQQRAEKRMLTPAQYMRRRSFGWSLVALGVLIGVTHWLAHLGVLYEDTGLWDLTIGYPTAALVGVLGAVVLSK
jgi:hypothetical protein